MFSLSLTVSCFTHNASVYLLRGILKLQPSHPHRRQRPRPPARHLAREHCLLGLRVRCSRRRLHTPAFHTGALINGAPNVTGNQRLEEKRRNHSFVFVKNKRKRKQKLWMINMHFVLRDDTQIGVSLQAKFTVMVKHHDCYLFSHSLPETETLYTQTRLQKLLFSHASTHLHRKNESLNSISLLSMTS